MFEHDRGNNTPKPSTANKNVGDLLLNLLRGNSSGQPQYSIRKIDDIGQVAYTIKFGNSADKIFKILVNTDGSGTCKQLDDLFQRNYRTSIFTAEMLENYSKNVSQIFSKLVFGKDNMFPTQIETEKNNNPTEQICKKWDTKVRELFKGSKKNTRVSMVPSPRIGGWEVKVLIEQKVFTFSLSENLIIGKSNYSNTPKQILASIEGKHIEDISLEEVEVFLQALGTK